MIVEAGGAGAANLPIEVYLDSNSAHRVAEARSGPDGTFRVDAMVPAGLQPGPYSVVVRTPGDARRRASSSRAVD